jgi:translation elongation factor EF-Ts
MKRSGIAFVLLLILCVGIMAAYIIQWQQVSDDDIEAEEQAAQSVSQAPAPGQDAESAEATLEKNIESTRHLQDKRKKLMDEMVEGGIAERIENPAGEPFVYVMRPFYGLSFEEQASLMNVVWSYYITEDRNSKVVTIYDNDTGQEVGSYSQAGLKMAGE